MTTQTSSNTTQTSVLKRFGAKAYRLLENMTESAYRSYMAQNGGGCGI
ncbi:MAG: hypothetical protein U9Q35_08005 [Pseudomonadota bacterium]|nr:hypothetical protein [Pseudomonadota bacterium]